MFVDHVSDFTHVHMHQHLTTDETIDAKHAFERLAEQHGVRILHYHCDNGRFADKAFVDDVRAAHQTITFCGVGAHHQNGIAERRIRDITENTRTSLLHAAHRWPKAIAANLWPQAIKHVVNVRNSLPQPGKTESPLSKFAGTSVQPNLKHFHPFGCPVYVLQAPLQTQSPFPKWGEHSRIGICLCHSPHHASSAAPLILSTQTGLVSPQFHCVFDDNFDTVKREQADTRIWKIKAHLQEAKERAAEVTTQSSLISGPKHQPATSLCRMAGTSHRHSKTCPNFFLMPLQQQMENKFKTLQPCQWRNLQALSQQSFKTRLPTKRNAINRNLQQLNLPSSSPLRDTPKPVIKSVALPDLRMQLTTANTWRKRASSPSATSIPLPTFRLLHQP